MNNSLESQVAGDILIIDDDLSSLQILSRMLVDAGHEVRGAQNGPAALTFVAQDPPDLILLDIRMPEMDGFEVCRRLHAQERSRKIPIIFLSALDNMDEKILGFQAGGTDYITKPFQAEEVLVRVETHISRSRALRYVEAQNIQLQQEIHKRTQAEEALQRAHDELEQRVEERTHELKRTNTSLIQEIKARQQAEQDAQEHLQFETLLAEISALFVNVPVNEVDTTIQQGLQRVIEFLDIDRGSLFVFSPDEPRLRPMNAWRVDGVAPAPARPFVNQIPEFVKTLRRNELVIFSCLDDLPDAFSQERVFFHEIGLKSGLAIPLIAEGTVFGMVTFGVVRQEKTWHEDLVQRLRLLGEIFANILTWRQKEEELRKSEERFRTFMDHNPAVIYIKDEAGRHIYCNNTLQESFDISREQSIGTTSYDLFPNEVAARLEAEDQLVRTQNVTRDLGEWSDTYNGEIRWWKEVKFPLPIDAETTLVGGIVVNITDLKQAEEQVQERLQFEQLLAQLSATFTNIPNYEVDQRITESLEQLVEFFDVDHAALIQRIAGTLEFQLTHLGYSHGLDPNPVLQDARFNQQFPWIVKKMLAQDVIALSRFEEIPAEAVGVREHGLNMGLTSLLSVPIVIEDTVVGFMGLDSVQKSVNWSDDIIQRLRLVGEVFISALLRKQAERQLREAFSEITDLKDRLEQENVYLRREIELRHKHQEIIGKSEALKNVLDQVEKVAETGSTVLIQGETGTGKELIANAIHDLSVRKDKSMVKVNCAVFSSNLIENELFGREKGAYTGALSRQLGRFELANGSTIFLDEISELPLELQAKLLRVLQEGHFERLGGSTTITVDIRVIAATNRDLEKEVQRGRFRQDLYYRLSVFPLTVPPLRERQEDIPLLVWGFIKEFGERMNKTIDSIPRKSLEALRCYAWPGNIRELRNLIERAMILSTGPTLRIDLPIADDTNTCARMPLEEVERNYIIEVLEDTGGRIRGKAGAAEILGLNPSTLYSRMRKLGIQRPEKMSPHQ